jgi:hypothetical protein
LGTKRIEVVLAEVPVTSLKLDPTNPRIRYQLEAKGLGAHPPQEELRKLLWESSEVKKLKRAIEENQGLIEAIIISGKDGTVLEGNCRLTSYLMLLKEAQEKGEDDENWGKIRARILPPEITREAINLLLGELHIAGKNSWTPFEQAAHLYRMIELGHDEGDLAKEFRQSKSYVIAKRRAYKLMGDFAELAKERKKKVDDFAQKWSWFEEFYKKCKPGHKDESANRVYAGPDLEAKFSEWVLNGQLPMAADVRKLYECLEDKNAIAVLDRGGSIDEAIAQVAASRPALNSKIWKQVEDLTGVLSGMPMSDIDDLRNGDAAKIALISNLLGAVKRVMAEGRLKF